MIYNESQIQRGYLDERNRLATEARDKEEPQMPALQQRCRYRLLQRVVGWIVGEKIHLLLPILPKHLGRFAPQRLLYGLAATFEHIADVLTQLCHDAADTYEIRTKSEVRYALKPATR